MKISTTGNLVPVIRKSEFDNEATSFLGKYCPEALEVPMAVPIEMVAKNRMNLKLLTYHLTEDFSIFGQMCFTGGLAEIYNKDEDEYCEIKVDSGTMIIDPDTFFERNLGCINNTIAHECFHWHRHRNYHFMQNILYSKQSVACRCSADAKDDKSSKTWSDEDWMEWQANGIAPHILLPRETFPTMADQFLKESRCNNLVAAGLTPSKQWVVDKLADFYKVSKMSVRIRIDELGISFQ
jgi:hypothetical protein